MREGHEPKGVARRSVLKAGGAGMALGALPLGGSFWTTASAAEPDDSRLAAAFAAPGADAKPGVYWYWMGGAVTKEGLSRDLEEMKEAGISRAMVFSIGQGGDNPQVVPPADALTPTWWAMVEHAAREAERLDMQLGLNMCDGWATAAGPWITPELSMQHVVWTDRLLDGGGVHDFVMPQPEAKLDYYRDIALLAVPIEPDWEATSASRKAQVTSNLPVTDLARLADPLNGAQVVETQDAGWIQFAFDAPFTLRSVTVRTENATSGYSPGVYRAANSLWVEACDDGSTFRPVGRLDYPYHGWHTDMTSLTHAVPPTTARYFRLVHRPEGPFPYEEDRDFGQDTALKLSSIALSAMPGIHHLPTKSAQQWGHSRPMSSADLPDPLCVDPERIVDLSSEMDASGRLRWRSPEGRWRLIRLGYTTTGASNSAAGLGQGLECDRFNANAAKLQFEKWFERVREGTAPAGMRTIRTLHVDSWEAGTQNWSPGFPEQFEALRGYSLRPYLATLAGVPVASAEASEAFLFDLRRTIGELSLSEFYGVVSNLAHEAGCTFSGEPQNPTFPAEGLGYARYLDMPMGEFWYTSPRNDKPTDVKEAVSGARIYGKDVIGAEAFTDVLMDWREHPFRWKALGDHNFCEGINRFLLHVWAMQPWPGRGPGMTLNGIGSHAAYTQSWWELGTAWLAYLARCQSLLQQGRAVADVAYFIGEDVPTRALLPARLNPPLPAGYAYDSIDRHALVELARVEDGDIVLPSGARYRLLVLPDAPRMTLPLAQALQKLVAAGATVVGPRPVGSPSLSGGTAADAEVRQLAASLWRAPGNTPRPAAGTVLELDRLEPLLAEMGLQPDLLVEGADRIEWIHRRGPGWDLYFLSNQAEETAQFIVQARMADRQPELWDPDRAEKRTAGLWTSEGGVTRVPLSLAPAGSAFLLFRRAAGSEGLAALAPAANAPPVVLEGKTPIALVENPGRWTVRGRNGRSSVLSVDHVPAPLPIAGPWLVSFAERLPAPKTIRMDDLVSWSEASDPDIRFYSGLATYRTTFAAPPRRDGSTRFYLDLGTVEQLASVRLNGEMLGTLWAPPFQIEVSDHLRERNVLEITVANTWRNRLIGDHGKPPEERVTHVVPMLRKGEPWLPGGEGDDTLDPAGLLGPVRLVARLAVPIS